MVLLTYLNREQAEKAERPSVGPKRKVNLIKLEKMYRKIEEHKAKFASLYRESALKGIYLKNAFHHFIFEILTL